MPEYTMVPVPPERVLEVYALLSGAPSHSADPEPPAGVSEPAPERPRATDSKVIARAYRESSDKMKEFLNYLADRPKKTISIQEVAKGIGYLPKQVGGMLGAFGHRWENRYASSGRWFFHAGWNYEENHMDYRMPDEAAVIIKETRSGS